MNCFYCFFDFRDAQLVIATQRGLTIVRAIVILENVTVDLESQVSDATSVSRTNTDLVETAVSLAIATKVVRKIYSAMLMASVP